MEGAEVAIMQAVGRSLGSTDETLLELARLQGLALVQRELDNGQLVWTWHGRGRSWNFLARRQALDYMAQRFG